jgi:predicted ferric reductase
MQYETWRRLHGILGTLAIVFAMTHIVLVGNYVETPWKRAFWLALSVIWIGLLVYTRVWKPVLMLRRPYVWPMCVPTAAAHGRWCCSHTDTLVFASSRANSRG